MEAVGRRKFVLWLAVAPGLSSGMPTRSAAEDGDEAAIRAVIAAQMEAFRQGETARAFDYASPALRMFFGSPARFGAMVEGGYPAIWHPGELRFLGLREEAGRRVERILLRDAAGAVRLYDYAMIATPEGWRIDGVWPVEPDAGV